MTILHKGMVMEIILMLLVFNLVFKKFYRISQAF
jgi:hypothetical protein